MIHPVVPSLHVVVGADSLAEHAPASRRECSTLDPGGPHVVHKFCDGWNLVI